MFINYIYIQMLLEFSKANNHEHQWGFKFFQLQ